MNGVDVSRLNVGDVLELDDKRAQMMIDLDWAERVTDRVPAPSFAAASAQSNFTS